MSNPDLLKLEDFERNPNYERRVVVFYDILGWRSRIAWAGQDAARIGELRRAILIQTRTMRLRKHWNISVSTFSDNIVVSQALGPTTSRLIAGLAISQISLGLRGILLRGGITIGDLVHDEESVFGPALNRAYELESRVAKYPRFVIDPDVFEEFGNLGALPVKEDGVIFLDPFRKEFVSYLRSGTAAVPIDKLREAGVPHPDNDDMFNQFYDDEILLMMLDELKLQIRAPQTDKDWEKIAWVYDRLAGQLGVPFARSYPRVRRQDEP